MDSSDGLDVYSVWYSYLIDVELVRNYNKINILNGVHAPAPNPILDSLIPSLLYVKLGAVLDEFLERYINANSWVIKKPLKNDFHGRISCLANRSLLYDESKLHNLREERNRLAHESAQIINWTDLDAAIDVAQAELQHLGLVPPRPKFEYFAERKPVPPDLPGVFVKMDWQCGLKRDGDIVACVQWQTNLYLPGGKPLASSQG